MSTYRNLINEMYLDGFSPAEDEPTFRVPENFDRYQEGSGWQAYKGGNDWENGTTGVAVYLNPEGYNKEMARIWFEVKFPPHLEEYVDSTKGYGTPSAQEVKKWGQRASCRWIRETARIHKETKKIHGPHDGYQNLWKQYKPWKECFVLALQSERMKPFVKKFGVDKTKWVGLKRSQPLNEALQESGRPSKFWWMDPDTNLIPVSGLGHAQKGGDILNQKFGVTIKQVKDAYPELYKRGYVRVGFAGMLGQYFLEVTYDRSRPPSLKQWQALKDLAVETGAEVINDEPMRRNIRVDECRLLFENFHENKEWFIYEGADTLTAVFEDNSRQTFKVHFHEKRLREDREKVRKKAAGLWKRLAMEIRKSAGLNKVGNPVIIPWQECFEQALKDPQLQEFVDDMRAVPIFESWMPMQNIWLAPDGTPKRVGSHEKGASEILARLGKKVDAGYKAEYDAMYRLGYARVVVGDNAHPLIIDMGSDVTPRLTKAQRQWVEDKSMDIGLNGEYSNAYGRTLNLEGSLNEMTYDELHQSMRDYKTRADLRKGTTTGADDRERGAKNVNVRSLRVVSTVGKDGNEHETSMFSYKSHSGNSQSPKQRWQGYLRFVQEQKDSPVAKTHEQSDVEVNCTCPDYKYVWAKANSDVDAGDTGKTTTAGFSAGGPVSKVEPKQTQYKDQGAKPVNIFEAAEVAPVQDAPNADIDKRWRFQGGNTNNGTYGKRIRNPNNVPGLCKHLIALADYIEKKTKSPVAPNEPGKEEPSAVAPAEPSKLKKTGKPVNIFESIKQFALTNPSFDVPYED